MKPHSKPAVIYFNQNSRYLILKVIYQTHIVIENNE